MTITNKYAGNCLACRKRVAEGAGLAVKVDGKWSCYHRDCAPEGAAPQGRPSIGQQLGYGTPLDSTITLRHAGDRIQIRPAGYLGADLFDAYRAACGGAEYNRVERCNYATVDLVGAIVVRLTKAGFKLDVDPGVTSAVQAWEARVKADTDAAAGRAAEIDAALRARGLALFPFQAQGVSWLAPRDRAILADDQGLGKSVMTSASLPDNAAAVVVAPAVAKGVWRRELARWRPELRVTVLDGRGSFTRWPEPGEVVVLNFDITRDAPMSAEDRKAATDEIAFQRKAVRDGFDDKAHADAAIAKIEAKLRADDEVRAFFASAPVGLVVVGDEAHAVKGSPKKVARSRRFKALADAAFEAKGRVWLLTGTPLQNRPPELWALLSLIRAQNIVFGSYPNFKKLCGASDTKWGTEWQAAGISSTVGAKLREVMLRRLKTDVLTELPGKIVEVMDVTLDADSIRRLDAIQAELAAQGIDLMEALKAAAANQSIAFDQVSRARAILSTAKAAAAMDMAADLEEQGEPVLVFSAYRAAVDVLAKRDGWAAITGDTPPAERTRIEESFQRGELRGIAATIRAAGVAITLTRGCNEIFIDSEWNPSLNVQAEDRQFRIGQARTVNVRYLRANHPIDERVFELCDIKQKMVARTVDAAAHRDGALAERVDASAALAGARASADHAQRQRDNEELADRIRRDRAKADADRVRSKAAAKAEAANRNRGWSIPAEDFETPPRPAQGPAEEWAVQALAQLTAMDGDHAFEENGVGFNKADTFVGQALAASARAGLLSDGEWAVAQRILVKYERQVGRAPAVEAAAS